MGRVRERAHSPAIREFVIKTSGSGIQTVASDSVADPIFWNTDRLKLYKKIIAIFPQQVLNLKLSVFFERNTNLFFLQQTDVESDPVQIRYTGHRVMQG